MLRILSILLFAVSVMADQSSQYDYDRIVSGLFWHELYENGGWSLYCGLRLGNVPSLSVEGTRILIEHIYSSNRMIRALGCESRQQCFQEKPEFRQMESDLHNLYPVWLEASNVFHDSNYGEIAGEYWRFDNCDLERENGLFEPRPLARGNIARAIFHMHHTYQLPLDNETLATLKRWNVQDPPSKQEMIRNDKIQALQGKRNRFIDNPRLADSLNQ